MVSPSVPPRNPYHEFMLSQPDKGRKVLSTISQGRSFLESGRHDEARRALLQALSLCPHAIPALNNLAYIALREGDNARALNIIDEVLQIDPDEPIAHALATHCWFELESDPMVRFHCEAALSGYIQLARLGDPVEADYPDRALLFVFQALLIAEDDAGIVKLYEATPDRDWSPVELTWAGIAHYNRGRINEAHLIWRRAVRTGKFGPARTYAKLAQHVLSNEVLPFTLDYDIMVGEDEDLSPFPSSSLALASLVNHVFTKRTRLAQEALAYLLQNDLPSQEYFLVRLAQNPRVTAGVRILAALHLLWIGYNVEIGERILRNVDEDQLGPSDKPVYYLLRAAYLYYEEGADMHLVSQYADQAYHAAMRQGMHWVTEYLDQLMDSEERVQTAMRDLDVSAGLDEWEEESPPFSLIPLVGDEADDATEPNSPAQKDRKGRKPPKGRGHNS